MTKPVATAAPVDPAKLPPPPPPGDSAEPEAKNEPTTAVNAEALSDQALALLKEAKNPEAAAAARVALDADPTEAMPYLVLGSALQDTGHWTEAHHTYELCVKAAKHGMVDECRAMLRRR